jgi:hypothetical protein
MISQGASEINISFVIKESDVPRAVRHLHARFFEADSQPAIGKASNQAARKANGFSRHSATQNLASPNDKNSRLNQAKKARITGSVGQNSSARPAAHSRSF